MRPCLLAVLILVMAVAPNFARALGAIHVIVLDRNNKPVAAATVTARPLCFPAADLVPSCDTGSDGKCAIPAVGPCTYFLSASRYADGYLDADQFDCGEHMEHCQQTPVALAKKNSTASVTMHLVNKGVFLKAEVVDAVTGKQIPPTYADDRAPLVYFEFRWNTSDVLGGQMPADKNGLILLPAEIPFRLKVSREGYQDWTYTSPGNPADHILVLHSGKNLTLHIRLQPNP